MAKIATNVLTRAIIDEQDTTTIDIIARERPEDSRKRKGIERELKTMREVLEVIEDYQRTVRSSF